MAFKTKNSSETNKASGLWNLHIIKNIIIEKIESLQKTCTLLYKIDIFNLDSAVFPCHTFLLHCIALLFSNVVHTIFKEALN